MSLCDNPKRAERVENAIALDFFVSRLNTKLIPDTMRKSEEGCSMNFERSDVKVKFNENARQYDGQRKKLIPCFDDFYSIAVSMAETNTNNPDILDIGAGTGLLSFSY